MTTLWYGRVFPHNSELSRVSAGQFYQGSATARAVAGLARMKYYCKGSGWLGKMQQMCTVRGSDEWKRKEKG